MENIIWTTEEKLRIANIHLYDELVEETTQNKKAYPVNGDGAQ